MPIDPSIIANSMSTLASNMPDVNALMQQRVQGAENIYKIETARQEEAAEAAKEQQAAIAQMMLPSVAAAFSDPSDAGLEAATSLMPPEAAETFAPFMDRLRGVPDVKLRQALLRAELMKDDEGRLILGQLEPTANMRLQADTAAQAQALKMRELQLKEEQFAASQQAPATAPQSPEEAVAPPMDPKVKLKLDQAYPQAVKGIQNAVTSFDQDIADLEALIADPGLKDISGVLGSLTPNIGPAARRAQALFDKIKSGAGLSALMALKAASPMGGALGNVSNQEGKKLEESVAAFAQNQDYNDLVRMLNNYLIDIKIAKQSVIDVFDETYAYRGEALGGDIATQAQERRTQVERETKLPQETIPLHPGVTVKKNK